MNEAKILSIITAREYPAARACSCGDESAINSSRNKILRGLPREYFIKQGEGPQIEFKESKSSLSKDIFITVCAFLNRSGGEVLLGVNDEGKVIGINNDVIEQIKKDFVTNINNPQKIMPTFYSIGKYTAKQYWAVKLPHTAKNSFPISKKCYDDRREDFFCLSIEEIAIKDRQILYIYIPQSSQVHRCNGRIYDRNEDGDCSVFPAACGGEPNKRGVEGRVAPFLAGRGTYPAREGEAASGASVGRGKTLQEVFPLRVDFDITDNTNLVTAMYLRKQTTYSENRVYAFVTINDFRKDLLVRVRKMAANRKPNHPWGSMDDLELLKSSQLYLKDYQSGKEGFTLASVLLLGKDDVILSILPHFRTDAILRKENLDRYDDRDDIRTNLLESYDRIMAFIAKHLPDKFYLEKEQNINVRDRIFREVAGNILIHREYLNPFPAKLIIEKERVYTENSNKPHGHGLIDPNNFSPFPKNPVIAKFFKEIGWADELGSGVRNLFKYGNIYSGRKPQLIEGDIFKTIIPFTSQDTVQDTVQVESLIMIIDGEMSRKEMQSKLHLKHKDNFRELYLKPAIETGLVEMTIPDKPNSKNQKYRLTQAGLSLKAKKK